MSSTSSSSSRPIPTNTPTSRYHPYSFNANLLSYRNKGPSSIASATSYAPSIVSTATTVTSTLPRHKQNTLRLKVNTSIAPSSHIWDEFYKEHGKPKSDNKISKDDKNGNNDQDQNEGEEEMPGGELTPRQQKQPLEPASQNVIDNGFGFTEDAALTELLSMFNLPSSNDSNGLQSQNGTENRDITFQHQSVESTLGLGLGDYPGAEFLNLPDTASTLDSHFPGIDNFDFTRYDFGQTIQPIPALPNPFSNNIGNSADPANGMDNIATHVITHERAHQDEISSHSSDSNHHFSPIQPVTTQTTNHQNSPSLIHQERRSHEATTSSVPPQTNVQTSTSNLGTSIATHRHNEGNAPVSSIEEDNNTSSTSSSSKRTSLDESYTLPISISSSNYPLLNKIKMKAFSQDKHVIHFQKEVLSIAAKFYTDLGDLFENTPSDVIKRGMSRFGLFVKDETVSDVLEDIKLLCGRLTARANDISGYPCDDNNVVMASDNLTKQNPSPHSTDPPMQSTNSPHASASGSISKPIDLTAPTPRSEGNTPKPVHNGATATPQPTVHLISAEPNAEFTPIFSPYIPQAKHGYNPYTPESIKTGPSSVKLSTSSSPLYSGTTPVNTRTPNPGVNKIPMDLPPLATPNNKVIHGPWKPSEVERLRTLVGFSQDVEDNAPIDHTDWTWVVDNFGGTRNRHQVLIKAVELGLRETSTHHSRRVKQKGYRDALAAMETELKSTSSFPLQSPLPPLLPSAQIDIRSDVEKGKDYTSPTMLGEAGRRHSNSSFSSEPSKIRTPHQYHSPLEVNGTTNTNTVLSPIRMHNHISPYTPKSQINSMGFKPYAHPLHTTTSSTAPPQSRSVFHSQNGR
ncbi:uncharacterized protein L201_007862 [Kwoniella dendrophila CBS 6074]|uniref:Transcription activator GCR1-like domain-containing protein n=1 Tax=Kwoniella dendrophila CBS 6074 TaxID=1295534 RepID=A0AAX4K7T0_9TREE